MVASGFIIEQFIFYLSALLILGLCMVQFRVWQTQPDRVFQVQRVCILPTFLQNSFLLILLLDARGIHKIFSGPVIICLAIIVIQFPVISTFFWLRAVSVVSKGAEEENRSAKEISFRVATASSIVFFVSCCGFATVSIWQDRFWIVGMAMFALLAIALICIWYGACFIRVVRETRVTNSASRKNSGHTMMKGAELRMICKIAATAFLCLVILLLGIYFVSDTQAPMASIIAPNPEVYTFSWTVDGMVLLSFSVSVLKLAFGWLSRFPNPATVKSRGGSSDQNNSKPSQNSKVSPPVSINVRITNQDANLV
eukprot:TRINITY_DN2777_c0_g1_i1.p1 TRINITY_DN2777_c0_g1~~TRINITY_DN2777_c0_g1_i1.p1  ORF type:complete len:311 (+),score=62.45 TRINITY_DN2777_c0_g1_i1:1026-1958(+)